MIIYGQGAIRCHPYVLAELQAANQSDSDQALNDFDTALFGHIGFSISNISRSLWCSLSGARLLNSPYSDETRRYYQLLTRFSANLAMLSDIAMLTLGADLKRKERISARLGDVLSHLYLASATLKRYNDDGRKISDLPFVQWSVEDCLYNIQHAIDELINNFPNKSVAIVLRFIIFPLGTWLSKPSDKLSQKVSILLQTPSAARNRLGHGQYLVRDGKNIFGRLEQTFEDIINCEAIFEKVCRGINKKLPFYQLDKIAEMGLEHNIISQTEADLLISAESGRRWVIQVDDFDTKELSVR
jgi:acyl-CoA dehydrogenase